MPGNPGHFPKGTSGNPAGRPKGSRARTALALDEIFDGEAEAITRKVIEMAKDGDPQAMRMCLDRLVPPRKDRLVQFDLPPVETVADVATVTKALLEAAAAGDITPGEAAELGKLATVHVEALMSTDIAERLRRLEEAIKK